MVNPDVELKALIAVLTEIQGLGGDVDAVVTRAKAGIMSGAVYAPSGAAAKPHVIDVLEKALECARPYFKQ